MYRPTVYSQSCFVSLSKLYKYSLINQSLTCIRTPDVNECEPGVSPPINDCDANATCINRPEYFECVCNLDFKDDSDTFEFNGRNCTRKYITLLIVGYDIAIRVTGVCGEV